MHNSQRILIISRDDRLLDEIQNILGSEGPPALAMDAHIKCAIGGEGGLAMAAQALARGEPYALALVEIDPDGDEATEAVAGLRELDRDMQCVLVGPGQGSDFGRMASRLGADNGLLLLKRPFDVVELRLIVGVLLCKWLLHRKNSRAQADLEQAANRWRSTFDAIDDPILIVGTNFKILEANRAARGLAQNRDLIGAPCHELLHNTATTPSICQAAAVLKSGQPVSFQVTEPTLGGRYLNVTISPNRDTGGKISELVHVLHDVTAGKEMEEQRQRLAEQLRQAQKMEAIGTLAGGIAHDFNNLLSPIIGFAELVAMQLDPKGRLYEDQMRIVQAAERARDLVGQILAFSRQKERNRQPLSVDLVVKEALKLLRTSIPSNIEIRRFIQPGCRQVIADPAEIHQVLLKLCAKASHAMRHSGGLLEVRLGERHVTVREAATGMDEGDYLVLEVRDSGPCIPPDAPERAFEPSSSTKDDRETGTGLALIYEIIKNHGGHLSVSSEPGRGSISSVYLPLVERPDDQRTKNPGEGVPGGRERIMVVDDEPVVLELQCLILERLGYTVTRFENPTDALLRFQDDPEGVDLVLIDQALPLLTGTDLAQRMLALRSNLPIVLCSAFSEQLDHEKLRAIGIREFVAKPVLNRALALAVRRALDEGPAG